MRVSFPALFVVIGAGILILGALFFIFPSEDGQEIQKGKVLVHGKEEKNHDGERKVPPDLARLKGTLLSPDGKPLALATFWCLVEDRGNSSTVLNRGKLGPFTTNHWGKFSIEVKPFGSGKLEIRVEGYSPARQEIAPAAGGTEIKGLTFKLAPGIVVLQGRVVDSQGKPVPGAILELSNPALGLEKRRYISNRSGDFEVIADEKRGTFTGVIRLEKEGKEFPFKEAPAGSLGITVKVELGM